MNIIHDKIILYKLIGDEQTLYDYCYNQQPSKLHDWTAVYFQLSVEHALRSIYNRHDQGYKNMNMLEITFSHTEILHFDNPDFGNMHISGINKALLIKKILNIDSDTLLMPSIDKNIMLLETPEDYEIIIPFNSILNNKLSYSEKIIDKYLLNSKFEIVKDKSFA